MRRFARCALGALLIALAVPGAQALAADGGAQKTPVPVVASYAVEEDSTGDWLQVADYARGQDIPFAAVGTLPDDIDRLDSYGYWLVAEPDEGLAYVAGSARLALVHEDGSVQDVTAKLEVRQEGAAVRAGAQDIVSALGELSPLDRIELSYTARFTDKVSYGFAEGNHSFAHVEYGQAAAGPDVGTASALRTQAVDDEDAGAGAAAAGATATADASALERSAQIRATVYTYRIDLLKTAQADKSPLAGARFALRDSAGAWYAADGGWTTSRDGALVVTTGKDGRASFAGVDSESYEVVEVEAPAGYDAIGLVDVAIATDVPEGGAANLTAQSKAAESIAADAATGIVSVTVADPAQAAPPQETPANHTRPAADRPATAGGTSSPQTGDILMRFVIGGVAIVALLALAVAAVARGRVRAGNSIQIPQAPRASQASDGRHSTMPGATDRRKR